MRKIPKLLIVIFLFSLFIRLYKLNSFPLGFHVDEAKVAWETYSIIKTAKDDHNNFLALYYNSFGDYRPTGIFYFTIPSLIIFGKTIFAVRFPAALLGALTTIPIYYLALQITKNKRVAILSSFLLAVIPWDITTSRATSEVVISTFLIISSLALFSKKTVLSFLLLTMGFFFYHSARAVGPLLMLVWIISQWSEIKEKRRVVGGFLISSLIAFVLVVSPTGMARYNQVKLQHQNIRNVVMNYLSYFDPNFYIGDATKPFRYKVADIGIVSLPIFILFLIGSYLVLKNNTNKILLLFMAIGPIPATLTLEDSPNLHRAFFILPFFVIIAAVGFNRLFEKHRIIYKVFMILVFVSLVNFLWNYMSKTNNFAYLYRNPQMVELISFIKNEGGNYNKIYVTNEPDSPYPWYAFFNNVDPIEMNNSLQQQVNGRWQFENIIWDNNRCPAGAAFFDAKKSKTATKIMVIDNGACTTDFKKDHPEAKVIKEFKYDGKVDYRIWEYQPTKF